MAQYNMGHEFDDQHHFNDAFFQEGARNILTPDADTVRSQSPANTPKDATAVKESRRRHRASPQAAMQLEDHEHGLFLGSPPFSTQQRLASSSTIHESMPPAAGFGVGTAQIDPSLTLGTRLSARTIPSYSAFGAMPAVQGQGECVRPPWPAMFTFQRGFGEERQLIQVNFQVQHIPSSYHVRSPQWSAGWPGAGPSLNQGFPLMQSLASVESPGTHDDLFSQPFHPVHKMPSRDQVSASPQQKYALGDGQLARPRRRLPNSAPHTKTASAGYQTIVPRTTRSSLTAQQQQQQQQQQNHHHHRHHSKQHSSYQATGAFAANTEGTGDARSSQSSKSKKGHDVTPQLAADEDRTAKDRFLLEKRLEGMSYKDIRIRGGFSEAESTLRGRHRTLTKTREARVRRPEWTDIDIILLKEGIDMLSGGKDVAAAKISWSQVAHYIADNGGSYHFGNATCHKKWTELVFEGHDM